MTQEKMEKVITAFVSAGTVLLVCLLSFLIYQWITLSKQTRREEKLLNEIAVLETQVEQAETEAEFYEKEFWLQWKLNELGIVKDKN